MAVTYFASRRSALSFRFRALYSEETRNSQRHLLDTLNHFEILQKGLQIADSVISSSSLLARERHCCSLSSLYDTGVQDHEDKYARHYLPDLFF
jgi:hypothetical protein